MQGSEILADGAVESRARPWLPVAVAAGVVATVAALLGLLWFGLAVRDRGTVGVASVPFREAPDFELGLFDGSSLRLSEVLASGRPAVVNFWASWCVPCADEAPLLEAVSKREKERATFIGVDVQDVEADARAFIRKFGISYPNGGGGAGPISIAYGMRGVPETYFVTAERKVVRKWNGPLTAAGLDQFLAELYRANAAPATSPAGSSGR